MILFNNSNGLDYWLKFWLMMFIFLFLVISSFLYYNNKKAERETDLVKSGFVKKVVSYDNKKYVIWVKDKNAS